MISCSNYLLAIYHSLGDSERLDGPASRYRRASGSPGDRPRRTRGGTLRQGKLVPGSAVTANPCRPGS